MVHGGHPPFCGGCFPPLHPWPPLIRGGFDGWFSGRTPKGGRCTQSRHAPAWLPQWPHIDVDLSPTATQRIVASSLQARLYIRPYRPPGCRAYAVARILQLKQAGKLFFTVSLVVWSLDRLGRDLKHLVGLIDTLTQQQVGLKVLAGAG